MRPITDTIVAPCDISAEAKINLILFNPHAGTMFKASDPDQVAEFRNIVIQVSNGQSTLM